MAQTQQPPIGRESALVDQFEEIVNQLIGAATAYVAAGQEDESASSNIRRVRVLTNALSGALNSIQFMPRMPGPWPTEPEPASQAPPPPEPRRT